MDAKIVLCGLGDENFSMILLPFQSLIVYMVYCILSIFSCTAAVFFAVPPAYYAHLAAFRARFYLEPDMQENGCAAAGRKGTNRSGGGESAGVRPLPALKENVKRVMFYC